MMQGPNGRERQVSTEELDAFEGLVFSTARMFAAQVKREEEDLAQELRIVVWRAMRAYDPSRSRLNLERFVFGALTNKIRDYKRDAARERDRRERNGVTFFHIEDMRLGQDHQSGSATSPQEQFDSRFHFVTRDEVYGRIEGDLFEPPSTVTEIEANVLVLLMMDMSKPEIMLRLNLARECVDASIVGLREKFSDWKPTRGDREQSSRDYSDRTEAPEPPMPQSDQTEPARAPRQPVAA